MFKASSIRFGRLLVEAKDCDESSYKRLGLCCPNCSKAVYWSKGSLDRVRHNKDGSATKSPVPPHFKHFKDVSVEEAEICEQRVRAIGKVETKKINQKIKHQRYKELEQRLWDMLTFSKMLSTNLYIFYAQAHLDLEKMVVKRKQPAKITNKYLKLYARIARAKKYKIVELLNQHTEIFGDAFESPIEAKLHQDICLEVVNFLMQPANSVLLEKTWLVSIYFALLTINAITKDKDGSLKKELKKPSTNPEESILSTVNLFNNYLPRCELFWESDINTALPSTVIGQAVFYFAFFIASTEWTKAFGYFDKEYEEAVEPKYMEQEAIFYYVLANNGSNVYIDSTHLQTQLINIDKFEVFREENNQQYLLYELNKEVLSGAINALAKELNEPDLLETNGFLEVVERNLIRLEVSQVPSKSKKKSTKKDERFDLETTSILAKLVVFLDKDKTRVQLLASGLIFFPQNIQSIPSGGKIAKSKGFKKIAKKDIYPVLAIYDANTTLTELVGAFVFRDLINSLNIKFHLRSNSIKSDFETRIV